MVAGMKETKTGQESVMYCRYCSVLLRGKVQLGLQSTTYYCVTHFDIINLHPGVCMHTHDIREKFSALLHFRPDNGIYILAIHNYTGIYLLESSNTSKYLHVPLTVLN